MSRLRSERGFTLIEVMIAVSIAAIGLFAVMTTLDTSRSSVSDSKQMQAASHAAEQSIEQVLSLGYSSIALGSLPAASSDQRNPGYYVGSGGTYTWNGPSGGSNTESLVLDSGAGFSSAPQSWGDSRYGGSIYRYVTWVCDSAVAGSSGCPAAHSYKRVTVAVTLKGQTAPRKPIYFQTLVADPNA